MDGFDEWRRHPSSSFGKATRGKLRFSRRALFAVGISAWLVAKQPARRQRFGGQAAKAWAASFPPDF
jgi:hypothetical protein